MNEETKAKRKPTYIIWQVIGDQDKCKWVRVGAGWANKDGKGVRLVFEAIPMTGRIMLRLNEKKSESAKTQAGQQ